MACCAISPFTEGNQSWKPLQWRSVENMTVSAFYTNARTRAGRPGHTRTNIYTQAIRGRVCVCVLTIGRSRGEEAQLLPNSIVWIQQNKEVSGKPVEISCSFERKLRFALVASGLFWSLFRINREPLQKQTFCEIPGQEKCQNLESTHIWRGLFLILKVSHSLSTCCSDIICFLLYTVTVRLLYGILHVFTYTGVPVIWSWLWGSSVCNRNKHSSVPAPDSRTVVDLGRKIHRWDAASA